MEKGVLLMKRRPRIYYSNAQKALMRDRWKEGESLNSIARLLYAQGRIDEARKQAGLAVQEWSVGDQ